MKTQTMSVELMFDKHAKEFNRFDKISDKDKLHPTNRLVCFLAFILKKNGIISEKFLDMTMDKVNAFMSSPELNLNILDEEDVIYLLRCGAKYDRENDCLLFFNTAES